MHLLYLDESGSTDANHFVVAGFIVNWRGVVPLKLSVEKIVSDRLPKAAAMELHAGHMRAGRRSWSRIPRDIRHQMTEDVVRLIVEQSGADDHPVTLVAVVADQSSDSSTGLYDRSYRALFGICESLIQAGRNDSQILAIADKTRQEPLIQALVNPALSDLAVDSSPRAPSSPFLEPPLFIDSRMTRLVQLADFAAHWLYRAYEHDDTSILDQILPAFDRSGGNMVSLVHLTDRSDCSCAACRTRR